MYLVDTSAWIRHFSKSDDFDLRVVCEPHERILCLPVYQEILQGIRKEQDYRAVRSILLAGEFVEVPLGRERFDEAVELYRIARRQGLTIRSSVDCLIAACAQRHGLVVVHSDRDYLSLSRVSALEQIEV